ncbi:transcription elongation factor A protein-like 9 [Erethizon dorsatum]
MKPCQKIEEKPENENEPKCEEEPKTEEKPEEEREEEEKAEETFRERLVQSLEEFKEDIHNRHLSNEDKFREVEIDEIRRVRNKLVVMRWKVNRNHPYLCLM